MGYKALYRTYRPSTFEEVAGQKHIVKTLQNALANNKIAHAYLFCGPRGTGKTSMAKLFAKALNCEEGIGHQCNVCGNCTSINDGSHPDVIEIDAASNNGVDEVRSLIEKVKYSPIKGKYKVYIIDEVHMMSSGAFNALLKTLEEPPAHVIFILATTEPHKVLPTILSRCQRYDFSKVDDASIKERIKTILDKEMVDYEERAIDLIISLADGGVRDALSILDQTLAYAGPHLFERDILDIFGLAGMAEKLNLLKAIIDGNVSQVLKILEAFIAHGIDIKRLNNDLLDMLKDILIYEKTGNSSLLLCLKENETIDLLNGRLSLKKCGDMIDILLKAQSDFRLVSNIRSLFEVVLLKLTTLDDAPVPTEVKKVVAPLPTPTPKSDPLPESKPLPKPTLPKPEFAPETPVIQPQKPVKVLEMPSEVKATIPEEKVSVKQENPLKLPEINASFATEGEALTIDDDTLVNVMTCGNKEEKIKLFSRWDELSSFAADPKIGKFVSILKDGRPFVICKECLVLEYEFITLVNKVNLLRNQSTFSKIIESIIGRKVVVYAMPRAETLRVSKIFLNLRQLQKLPKPSEIKIEIKGIIL